MIDGVVVNKSASYRITFNNFVADGGDGFAIVTQCTNPLGGEVDIDTFARYLGAHSPVALSPSHAGSSGSTGRFSLRSSGRGRPEDLASSTRSLMANETVEKPGTGSKRASGPSVRTGV